MHEPAARKNTGNRLQQLANVLTIIVALAAIGLSISEGRENRRHNRLSVLPHLEAWQEVVQKVDDPKYSITYGLKNTGLGPAVIKNLHVYQDGQQIFDGATTGDLFHFKGLIAELDALPFQVGSFVNSRGVGELLATDELHLLFRLQVPPEDSAGRWAPAVTKDEVLDRYSFLFCYCSVYDENCKEVTIGVPPPDGAACTFK